MKAATFYSPLALPVLIVFFALGSLHDSVAQYTWGTNGAGGGGTGAWNTSSNFWYNGVSAVAWPSSGTNNDAVFAGTAGTVTVSTVSVNDITFKTTGYQLNSGTITLNGATPTITVDPGLQATINSAIAGSAGLYKAGAGTLLISSSSSSWTGGLFIQAGRIGLSTTNDRIPTNMVVTLGGVGTSGILQLGSSTTARNQTLGGLLATGSGGNVVGSSSGTASILTLNIASGDNDFGGSGVIGGTSAASNNVVLVKTGAGTLTLSGSNSYTNRTTNSAGTLLATRNDALNSTVAVVVTNSGSTLAVRYGASSNYSQAQVGTLLGKTTFGSTGTAFGFDTSDASGTYSNNLGMAAGLTKLGANTLTLLGTNSFSGATTVSAGTLNLNTTSGSAAGSTASVSVSGGAVLLISQSDQVNNTAGVTLSGGTIRRASGVSEVFGNLSVTSASTLDFGSGSAGNLSFGTYAQSALLTVQNFFQGNTLVFSQDLVGANLIAASSSGGYNNGIFAFADGFTTSWNGTDTFTITAIPEPSAIFAATGLLGFGLWPLRRHLVRRRDK